ncbi:MAG: SRPBCC family protein [Gammaproteobacteria bacterium]|nr:SRPBCC family protein [Gammaproteobacteria bacterium]
MQKLLYAIGGLIVVLIVIGLALPRHARVVSEIRIDAYPATVFSLANDFRRVRLWSTLVEADPNARILFSGPSRGEGAAMAWDGQVIGSGTQLIVNSEPHTLIETTINPGEPGEARTRFEVVAEAGETFVRWTFEADYGFNLVGRYFALMAAGIIRRDHNNGLENLRELAESLPRIDFSDLEIERLVVEASDIAYLRVASRPEPAAMSEGLGDAYFEVLNFIDRHGLTEAGAPLAIARSFSGSELLFDAAIPVRGVTDSTPRDNATVKIGKTHAGSVIRVRHTGPYRSLANTHRKISAYLSALGIERNGASWESYTSDPTKVAEGDLVTYVYYPIIE